jgi:alpha-beta hydrolase superfamily lysophospholipase
MVAYESKMLEREHYVYNIPDNDLDDFANIISSDLITAGIGKKPYIIVSFSLGGAITRSLVVRNEILRE